MGGGDLSEVEFVRTHEWKELTSYASQWCPVSLLENHSERMRSVAQRRRALTVGSPQEHKGVCVCCLGDAPPSPLRSL